MLSRLLDRFLGKRHKPHWPRGVKPMFPGWAEHFQAIDAELWEDTKHLPWAQAIFIWRGRHPGSI